MQKIKKNSISELTWFPVLVIDTDKVSPSMYASPLFSSVLPRRTSKQVIFHTKSIICITLDFVFYNNIHRQVIYVVNYERQEWILLHTDWSKSGDDCCMRCTCHGSVARQNSCLSIHDACPNSKRIIARSRRIE
jgi:hypothetical protein